MEGSNNSRGLMSLKKNFFRVKTSPAVFDWSDVTVLWSLRKAFSWSNAVLKVRRSSDNATAYVFIDGAVAYGEITLNSYISTSSDTTPSTTTLGTWAGSDDVFVETWYGMTYNDIIDTNKKPTQATTTAQPKFMTAGVINTENSKPTIDFDGGDYLRQNGTNILSEVAPNASAFSMFSVSRNDTASNFAAVFCTHWGSGNRQVIANDTRTTGGLYRAYFAITGSGNYFADLDASHASDQRLVSMTMGDSMSKSFTSYYNGITGGNDTYAGAWGNDDIIIGAQHFGGSKANWKYTGDCCFSKRIFSQQINPNSR